MSELKKYLSINRCPTHNYYMVSIEDDRSGHRLTPSKCCGSWETVRRWRLDDSMVEDFIKESGYKTRHQPDVEGGEGDE